MFAKLIASPLFSNNACCLCSFFHLMFFRLFHKEGGRNLYLSFGGFDCSWEVVCGGVGVDGVFDV